MAYIEAHQALVTHRKTLRLARLLHVNKFDATGRLIALWCWALDSAPEGVIPFTDQESMAEVMGYETDPGELCEKLVEAGYLDRTEQGYLLHDWWEYAGRLIEKRKSDAERKRAARSQSGHPTDVSRTSSGHPSDIRALSDVTVPNLTVPLTKERENHKNVGARFALVAADAADEVAADALAPETLVPSSTPPARPRLPRTASQPLPLDGDAVRVAARLRDAILSHKPDAKDALAAKQPGRLQNWARPIDCMLRLDQGRTVERALAVIEWLPTSEFWRRNILSTNKFREQFDRLELQMFDDRAKRNGHGHLNGNGHHPPSRAAPPEPVRTFRVGAAPLDAKPTPLPT